MKDVIKLKGFHIYFNTEANQIIYFIEYSTWFDENVGLIRKLADDHLKFLKRLEAGR